LSLRWIFRT